MFGECDGEIKNVGLENIDVTGNDEVGGLVAYGSCAKLEKAYYTNTTCQTNGIGYGAPMSGTAQLVTMDGLDIY